MICLAACYMTINRELRKLKCVVR